MNPDVIIPIVLIIVVVSLLRTRMGVRPFWERSNEDGAENARLRQQVEQLQDRIRILERIVTDRGAETAAQIEALRDHERIVEKDKA